MPRRRLTRAAVLRYARALPHVRELLGVHRSLRKCGSSQADQSTAGGAARRRCRSTPAASRNGSRARITVAAPTRELQYVLRAYDKNGNFDETTPQPLWLVYTTYATPICPEDAQQQRRKSCSRATAKAGCRFSNIPLGSGTVKVRGSGIPAQHSVWVAGKQVPVDRIGNFVAEEMLPSGLHTVEVAVLDEARQRLDVPARPGVRDATTGSTSASRI